MNIGDVYVCEGCGAEFTVTKACDCQDCQLKCCDKPLRLKTGDAPGPGGSCCCAG